MSESERRMLAGVAGFLLLASLLRHGLDRRTVAVELPADEARAARLAEESRELRDDREARSRPLAPGERIDLNAASEVDLNRLTGVGPATAAAIVRERETRGPFASADDLVRVRGIGPATVERLRGEVEAGPVPGARPGARGGAAAGGASGVASGAARGLAPGTPPGMVPHTPPGMVPRTPPGLEPRAPGRASGARGPASGARGPAPGAVAPLAPWSAPGLPGVVDVNRASEEELQSLPGIGPAIARRIVETRARRGGFGSPEELLEVPGIGPATLERLRARVHARR